MYVNIIVFVQRNYSFFPQILCFYCTQTAAETKYALHSIMNFGCELKLHHQLKVTWYAWNYMSWGWFCPCWSFKLWLCIVKAGNWIGLGEQMWRGFPSKNQDRREAPQLRGFIVDSAVNIQYICHGRTLKRFSMCVCVCGLQKRNNNIYKNNIRVFKSRLKQKW